MLLVSDVTQRERFRSQHQVHTKTPDGDELLVLTGVALPHWKTDSSGEHWENEELVLHITIRDTPRGKIFRTKQCAPHVTLNAVGNDRRSRWAAWALDDFGVDHFDGGSNLVRVRCHMAGRDTDGWIYRVAYHITLVGEFVDAP